MSRSTSPPLVHVFRLRVRGSASGTVRDRPSESLPAPLPVGRVLCGVSVCRLPFLFRLLGACARSRGRFWALVRGLEPRTCHGSRQDPTTPSSLGTDRRGDIAKEVNADTSGAPARRRLHSSWRWVMLSLRWSPTNRCALRTAVSRPVRPRLRDRTSMRTRWSASSWRQARVIGQRQASMRSSAHLRPRSEPIPPSACRVRTRCIPRRSRHRAIWQLSPCGLRLRTRR